MRVVLVSVAKLDVPKLFVVLLNEGISCEVSLERLVRHTSK